MTEIDFKSEALEFSKANGCPPAIIIEAAMRHAAGLVVDAVHADIKSARASLVKAQAANVSNGDTKIIQAL